MSIYETSYSSDNTTFDCKLSQNIKNDKYNIIWLRNNELYSKNATLELGSLEDSFYFGTYKCVVQLINGQKIESNEKTLKSNENSSSNIGGIVGGIIGGVLFVVIVVGMITQRSRIMGILQKRDQQPSTQEIIEQKSNKRTIFDKIDSINDKPIELVETPKVKIKNEIKGYTLSELLNRWNKSLQTIYNELNHEYESIKNPRNLTLYEANKQCNYDKSKYVSMYPCNFKSCINYSRIINLVPMFLLK